MIEAHIIDSRGVYLHTEQVDELGPQPAGAVYAELPQAQDGYTRMWVGSEWQQVLDADVPPLPEPAAPIADLRITKLAFRNRFTHAEKAGIELAALDNPTADMQTRMQAASLRAYLKDVDAATFIDLSRQDLADGVNSLETLGVIAASRALEILSHEISDVERYKG